MASPFLCTLSADWHIAKSAWARRGIDGDSYAGLRQVVDLCLERQTPLVAAGDLFDSQEPSALDAHVVRKQLARMRRAQLPVYYLQGNHDRIPLAEAPAVPWLSALSDGPLHVHGRSFALGPYTAYGLDWHPASRLADALATVPPGTDILVAHQSWAELRHTGEAEGRLALVPHVRYVLTGDLHVHIQGTSTRADGTTVEYFSPGSLGLQEISEEEHKHVFVLRCDPDRGLTAESVALRTRRVFRIRVDTATEFDTLLTHDLAGYEAIAARAVQTGEVPNELARPLLRVEYADDIPDAFDRLTAATADTFHLFPRPVPRADDVPAVDQQAVLEALAEGGLPKVLAALPLDDLDEPEQARQDAQSFLAAADPAAFLDEFLNV